MPRFGITTKFVDTSNPANVAKAIHANTKAVFMESIGNPKNNVDDFAAIARIAHDNGLPLLLDNTFAKPFLCRPIEHGADLVFHSATKFIGGHGIAIGGILVDGGTFDWEKSGKFPTLTEPYAGYHGLDFAEEFGPHAFIMRARAEGLRDFGACLSPQNAFYLLQGLETLPVRMAKIFWIRCRQLVAGRSRSQHPCCGLGSECGSGDLVVVGDVAK